MENFGPAFFLASWLTGQLFRVKKQADVETKLTKIEVRAESLLQKLNGLVQHFAGHTYGPPNGVHLVPRVASIRFLELVLVNPSQYPVIDFSTELSIHHVSATSVIADPSSTQRLSLGITFPQAEPHRATTIELQSERTGVIARMSTRTHTALQLFVIHRFGDEVSVAFQTYAEGALAHEDCSSELLRVDLHSLEEYANRSAYG